MGSPDNDNNNYDIRGTSLWRTMTSSKAVIMEIIFEFFDVGSGDDIKAFMLEFTW